MPRMNLSTEQREYAIHALKQMQVRDKPEIDKELSMARLENDIRDFSFGRMMFSIPEDHRRMLALIFPAIDSEDGKERSNAWKKLMKHELTRPYRLNPKESGNARKTLHRRHNKQLIST